MKSKNCGHNPCMFLRRRCPRTLYYDDCPMHALTVVRNSGDDVIATPHHTTPHRVPQSKFQREVQVNSDKLLEEFEAENEQLLGDLSKSRANLVALQEQTANEARARAEDAEAEGSMPHAQVAEMEARLAVQAVELKESHSRVRRAEELIDESEQMLQEESDLRAAAEAKLEAVVTEIEQEEGRMLEEIELLKFSIEDKEGTHRRVLRNLTMETDLLRENEENLSLEIVRLKRGARHGSTAGEKSLASELAGFDCDAPPPSCCCRRRWRRRWRRGERGMEQARARQVAAGGKAAEDEGGAGGSRFDRKI